MDIFSPFWISLIIFFITFFWIISERVHRSLIAFAGAITMAIIWNFMGFYSFEDVGHSIDYNTLLLLWGMMMLVAVMEKTWVFEYLAIKIAQKTHGSYWLLLVSLGALTAILSMALDNVSTIILIAPMTIRITKILHFNPTLLLISEAILSNIWGIGTLVWDPTAIIIGSAANFSFLEFSLHSIPVVLIVWLVALTCMLYLSRHDNKIKPKYREKLMELDARKAIIKPIILKKSLFVLSGVILWFFFHHSLELPTSSVALIWACIILLLVAPHDNPQKYMKKLQLSVFLFFSSLFILVWGLEAAGVLDYIAWILAGGVKENIMVTALIILWATAILSSVIDNIPMTIAMIPIISYFETQGIHGSNLLWWALIFWVGFGGNITPIGSTANVVVMSKLELAGEKIHLKDWLKIWVPVVFLGLFLTSIILILFEKYFM